MTTPTTTWLQDLTADAVVALTDPKGKVRKATVKAFDTLEGGKVAFLEWSGRRGSRLRGVLNLETGTAGQAVPGLGLVQVTVAPFDADAERAIQVRRNLRWLRRVDPAAWTAADAKALAKLTAKVAPKPEVLVVAAQADA